MRSLALFFFLPFSRAVADAGNESRREGEVKESRGGGTSEVRSKRVSAPIDISISGTERRQSIPNFSETIIEMVPPGDVCSWSPESRWLEQ